MEEHSHGINFLSGHSVKPKESDRVKIDFHFLCFVVIHSAEPSNSNGNNCWTVELVEWIITNKTGLINDPLGWLTVTAGSDHYFHTCCYQNKAKTWQIFSVCRTLGRSQWIIGDIFSIFFHYICTSMSLMHPSSVFVLLQNSCWFFMCPTLFWPTRPGPIGGHYIHT